MADDFSMSGHLPVTRSILSEVGHLWRERLCEGVVFGPAAGIQRENMPSDPESARQTCRPDPTYGYPLALRVELDAVFLAFRSRAESSVNGRDWNVLQSGHNFQCPCSQHGQRLAVYGRTVAMFLVLRRRPDEYVPKDGGRQHDALRALCWNRQDDGMDQLRRSLIKNEELPFTGRMVKSALPNSLESSTSPYNPAQFMTVRADTGPAVVTRLQ